MIEVGEYVRTKDGIIAKVTYVDGLMLDTDNEVFDFGTAKVMEIPTEYIKEYVLKHSDLILKLVEQGDYVNGIRVKEHFKGVFQNGIELENGYKICYVDFGKVQDIVTHEQFEQIKYKVKDN